MLWGVLPYETFGVIIQHSCQALFLFVNIYWAFWKNWSCVQSRSFTMHTTVMMMKTHSYTALNGDLSVKLRRLRQLNAELPKSIASGSTDTEKIEHMELDITFLERELVHGNTRYPYNIIVANFLDIYLCLV